MSDIYKYFSYLYLHIQINFPPKIIEADEHEPVKDDITVAVKTNKAELEPGDVDLVILDTVNHLPGEVEDGVLVWLD